MISLNSQLVQSVNMCHRTAPFNQLDKALRDTDLLALDRSLSPPLSRSTRSVAA